MTITEIATINDLSKECGHNHQSKKVKNERPKITLEKTPDILFASISIEGFLFIALSSMDTSFERVESEKSFCTVYLKSVSTQIVPLIILSPYFLKIG